MWKFKLWMILLPVVVTRLPPLCQRLFVRTRGALQTLFLLQTIVPLRNSEDEEEEGEEEEKKRRRRTTTRCVACSNAEATGKTKSSYLFIYFGSKVGGRYSTARNNSSSLPRDLDHRAIE